MASARTLIARRTIMDRIMNNPRFAEAFERLARVTLNPRRHTAANALVHSEAVAAQAGAIARLNGCGQSEQALLEDLGRAHDIGKITGTARPERSLEVLHDCGVTDPAFLALVKWHDTSLPWFRSSTRGQPPTEKAWRRLAAEVDVRLLAMFMVADRVDAPPGWRRNTPTRWFLDEARKCGLLGTVTLDVPGHPGEVSAGGVLVHSDGDVPRALVVRLRAGVFELPKGGIEWDEIPEEAAVRETREEAGVDSALHVGRELGHVDYALGDGHLKRVRYFMLSAAPPFVLGPQPDRTHERRWITRDEVSSLPLVNEELRPLLLAAFTPAGT
jgi:8-oxo-dGTP pyrophosphatase MutT (NUDIX family)